MENIVYLDYAAATPVDQRVIDKMVKCLQIEGCFANSSARDHIYGWQASEEVEAARDQVAKTIGASPTELIFTSGATESNNQALLGMVKANKTNKRHIITTKIEHKSILSVAAYIETLGYKVSYIDTYKDGTVDIDLLKQYISDDTFLVSIAHANSVLGSVNDIHALATFCHDNNIYFHTDCAQSATWFDLNLDDSDISLVSLTPEKIYGPKGVGALYINKKQNIKIEPLIYGGTQERGLRAGTVATHQVVGMGEAFSINYNERLQNKKHIEELRNYIQDELLKLDFVSMNGTKDKIRLPGVLSLTFKGISSHMLLPSMPLIAASTGSACSSSELKPSYILKAIGLSDDDARSSIRISIGKFTKKEDVELAVSHIKERALALKGNGNFWQINKEK